MAVIVVRHLNKNGSGKAIYRGGGSIAFSGTARGAFLVTRHPEDKDARVFASVKNNLGADSTSLAYRLSRDPVYRVVRVGWEGQYAATAQELLDGPGTGSPPAKVAKFLMEFCGEPRPWKEIVARGRGEGLSEHALWKARDQVLEKVAGREGNRDVTWRARYGTAPLPLCGELGTLPTSECAAQNGNGALASANTSPGGPLPHSGEAPCAQNQASASCDDTPMTAQERREMELAALPMICDQCGQPGVKFADPVPVARCRAHHPDLFKGAIS